MPDDRVIVRTEAPPDRVGVAEAVGPRGASIELQVSATHIQWRQVGAAAWSDIIAIADLAGPAGQDGADGTNGTDGIAGANGQEVSLRLDSGWVEWQLGTGAWTHLVEVAALQGPQGDPGHAGAAGADGANGASAYELAVANGFVGDQAAWLASLVGATGAAGATGDTGAAGANGVGVPAGGTTGQVLKKTSATDFATEWGDPASGLPAVGSEGDVLKVISGAWAAGAPSGGSSLARATATVVTASLATDASESSDIALGNTFHCFQIAADKDCRVTLHVNSTYATADAAREVYTNPTGAHGVILDAVLAAGVALPLIPAVLGAVISGSTRIRVTNMQGTSQVVTVTLNYVTLET